MDSLREYKVDQESQQNVVSPEGADSSSEEGRRERFRLNRQIRMRLKDRRAVYILPNMFTMTSMFLGFLSIIWAVQGRFDDACLALLVSALMDGLDGKVARLTHSASAFGVQFDSLADLVAFGIAPAILSWEMSLQAFGRFGVACAFIYAGCGALRLARFNVMAPTAGKRFFMGLPIPAAACTLICYFFLCSQLPEWCIPAAHYFCLLLTVGLGLLMVSTVRYFSFKEYDFLRAHPYRTLVAFVLSLALLYSAPKIISFLYCAVYILSGLLYNFVILPKRNSQLLHTASSSDE